MPIVPRRLDFSFLKTITRDIEWRLPSQVIIELCLNQLPEAHTSLQSEYNINYNRNDVQHHRRQNRALRPFPPQSIRGAPHPPLPEQGRSHVRRPQWCSGLWQINTRC